MESGGGWMRSSGLIIAASAISLLLLVAACGGASLRPIIGANIDVSRAAGPDAEVAAAGVLEDRPVLAVDTSPASGHRGRIWMAWTSYVSRTGRSKALRGFSDDQGVHWSKPQPAGPGGYEPSLAVAGDGSLIEASA